MLAIPFGIFGAVLGHFIVGIPMSLLSFFGVLALSGVVVNDALILTSRYDQIRHDDSAPYETAVIKAGQSRFRAVFLTSLTTFCGLIPLILETSEEAQFLIPTAVSLTFGALFATLIPLIVIPVLLRIRLDAMALIGGSESAAETPT